MAISFIYISSITRGKLNYKYIELVIKSNKLNKMFHNSPYIWLNNSQYWWCQVGEFSLTDPRSHRAKTVASEFNSFLYTKLDLPNLIY